MAIRKRREIFCFVLLVWAPLYQFASVYSLIQEVITPQKSTPKQFFETKSEKYENSKFRTSERNRRLKYGKTLKSTKKSKKSKKYKGYYEDSYYYYGSYNTRRPVPSPTRSIPVRSHVPNVSKYTHKPISYHDPSELSEYDSYADMIDYYYVKHGGNSNSIDIPKVPTFSPIRRPGMTSPIWSYSEDEVTELPTIVPSTVPSQKPLLSPAPSTGQCMVRVAIDQCSALLQSIEPEEGCDCYNFCGGIYLGCCPIDEPCPLSCEVFGGFVAGCRFGDTLVPSEAPSFSPSVKDNVSQEPTLSATIEPTTLSPTIPTETPPSGERTNMPTKDILSIPLESFTLEYEVALSRPIAQSDLVVLTSITNSYLQVYMSGFFQSDSIVMLDFVTEYDSSLEDPESSVVLVTFRSTAFFDPDTQELPSRIDLEEELASAFQGSALAGYLGRVQALPDSNAFSKTSQIFMIENTPSTITIESREFSGVAAATALFAVMIVISLASLSWYRTRRKRRRLEASDQFLRNSIGIGDMVERNASESDDEVSELTRSEKRLTTTLLDEIERIEDMHRDLDSHAEIPLVNRDKVSQRASFESDESYLFEDDTIDDEEINSTFGTG